MHLDSKMAPRWPKKSQDGPKMTQDGPTRAPRWPKMAQEGPRKAALV